MKWPLDQPVNTQVFLYTKLTGNIKMPLDQAANAHKFSFFARTVAAKNILHLMSCIPLLLLPQDLLPSFMPE